MFKYSIYITITNQVSNYLKALNYVSINHGIMVKFLIIMLDTVVIIEIIINVSVTSFLLI